MKVQTDAKVALPAAWSKRTRIEEAWPSPLGWIELKERVHCRIC